MYRNYTYSTVRVLLLGLSEESFCVLIKLFRDDITDLSRYFTVTIVRIFGFDEVVTFVIMLPYVCMYVCMCVCVTPARKHDISRREAWTDLIFGM